MDLTLFFWSIIAGPTIDPLYENTITTWLVRFNSSCFKQWDATESLNSLSILTTLIPSKPLVLDRNEADV